MDRSSLALLAGNALVTAARTRIWADVKTDIAAVFGLGAPDWKTLRRLDATHAELSTATRGALRRARIRLASEWSVRFKDLLAEHPGVETDVTNLVAGIRTKTGESSIHPTLPERSTATARVNLLPRSGAFPLSSAGADGASFDLIRWTLIGSGVIAGFAAFTHHFLVNTKALDFLAPWANSLLSWPTTSTQPILAGCAAFCLCAIAVRTNDWHKPSGRTVVSLIASGLAAAIGTGPMMIVCWAIAFQDLAKALR